MSTSMHFLFLVLAPTQQEDSPTGPRPQLPLFMEPIPRVRHRPTGTSGRPGSDWTCRVFDSTPRCFQLLQSRPGNPKFPCPAAASSNVSSSRCTSSSRASARRASARARLARRWGGDVLHALEGRRRGRSTMNSNAKGSPNTKRSPT